MGRNRFVSGDVERIPLSDGDWIEIKKKLNNGDKLALDQAGVMDPITDGKGGFFQPIDWAKHELERTLIFLTDWSFTKPDDKGREAPVQVSMASLKAIDPETFKEINQAILDYVAKQAEEQVARNEARAEAAKKLRAEAPPTGMEASPTPAPLASEATSGS